MKASSISFQAAVLLVIMGMGWGIIMAISEDHTTMPAHAHLNLLGWVSLFLFGIFYHLHPAIDLSRSAMVQVCVWIISTIGLTLGVAMIHPVEIGRENCCFTSASAGADLDNGVPIFVFIRREQSDLHFPLELGVASLDLLDQVFDHRSIVT